MIWVERYTWQQTLPGNVSYTSSGQWRQWPWRQHITVVTVFISPGLRIYACPSSSLHAQGVCAHIFLLWTGSLTSAKLCFLLQDVWLVQQTVQQSCPGQLQFLWNTCCFTMAQLPTVRSSMVCYKAVCLCILFCSLKKKAPKPHWSLMWICQHNFDLPLSLSLSLSLSICHCTVNKSWSKQKKQKHLANFFFFFLGGEGLYHTLENLWSKSENRHV